VDQVVVVTEVDQQIIQTALQVEQTPEVVVEVHSEI
jgi:hypothetical protein